MHLATALNIQRTKDNEVRREKVAVWYVTLPRIPTEEKNTMEKSLKYNMWKSLLKFVIITFILSLAWIWKG